MWFEMMRAGVVVLAATLVACGGEREDRPSTGATAAGSAASTTAAVRFSGTWWQPALDSTWQWQLQGETNMSYDVDVYDIDLFDSTPELIAGLHGDGRRVVCYLSAGSVEDWREDFDRFDEADIGEPLADWEGERWVDIRSPDVHAIMLARLDLARDKGCDGVEPDNVQGYQDTTGFALTYDDQVAYNRLIATAAHERGLAVGLKNGGPQVADLLDVYDFALTEECHEYGECAPFSEFITARKPVFDVEYRSTRRAALTLAESICPTANRAGFRTLILPVELDDEFRVSCFD
jgi:hypothetical protein